MRYEFTVLTEDDGEEMLEVINAAAERYRGVIPAEADRDPYMPMDELLEEIEDVEFYGIDSGRIEGVIGVQERTDLTLIRHLYVRPEVQRRGVGTDLLEMGIDRAASETVLVGTWKAAVWAIEFYVENGFELLGTDEELLSTYWDIPEYQREASVVLRYEK